ncbi:thioredoxin domain-containing protein [Flavobacterium sp.]|uniref:thioredoxin domain-containing protein n=1 Tax=Flavobacterium sp. TaxID=239 RepID=UPI002620A613|nr:thioredoxin domain-containing protein [Flavobacterium sp.]MDD3004273.1 thioredoxin domain-containing protein [Flavobacterium sp.]
MNELSLETSPYLLQHAQNPVHWKAWNEQSLELAQNQQKLIIVSIGYSACHWCHVMEHETFENDQAAATMNQHFISIKVDREERPDIDTLYMKAVQIMSGRGGWPLNAVCLPDGRPVWGGTYFKKDEWIATLEQLQHLYESNPEKMLEYAEKLHQGIESLNLIEPKPSVDFNIEILEPFVQKWAKSFDDEFGGLARAPKFMMPSNYKFLLRYGFQTQNKEILDFVNLTLTKMAYGGLFDTVDGGFSRYSVDLKWHVPHFEKMLYDNGQLVSLYADAYKLNQNPLYKEIIEKTLNFVSKELFTKEGGFYAALDADSLTENQHLEEGAFYVWKKEELQAILKTDFELFSKVFNINDFGYWEEGNYVLIQQESLEEIALKNNIQVEALAQKKASWEKILYQKREQRSKPRLDDKCLTSWNAIMLKGYADAYKATGTEKYLNIALQNAAFITQHLWKEDGNLHRNYKDGKSTINAFLEDYAHLIQAFIALYQTSYNEKWLLDAKQLTDYCLEHFFDEKRGLFAFSSDLDEALISKNYEIEDNVIPASNSVMAENLFTLSVYFSNNYYKKTAQEMLQKIIPNIDYPSAFSNWMNLFLNFANPNNELAITGPEAFQFSTKINAKYVPNITLAASQKESALPFLKNRFSQNKNMFFVCQNQVCQLPTEDFEVLKTQLKL